MEGMNCATNEGSRILADVCAASECQAACQTMCRKRHQCGHACGGVRDEQVCLPCLHVGCGSKYSVADECTICWTAPLGAAPTLALECGHMFHAECLRNQLTARWPGPRIAFGCMQCALCKAQINHPALHDLLAPLEQLQARVQAKALLRLTFDGLEKHPEVATLFGGDLAAFALHKYSYYPCHKCQQPYFGGLNACNLAAAPAVAFDPAELLCATCNPVVSQEQCPKHGTEFIDFKCRFCCGVSVWFCFGTTHFCEPCHNNHSLLTSRPVADHPACPAVCLRSPLGQRESNLPQHIQGADCPLGRAHPPTGYEFALGCSLCRNSK
jgi:E3 ubiquitin-protein ligase MYCBP2